MIFTGEKDQPAKKGYYILDTQSNEEELAIGQCSIIAQLNRTRQCITLFMRSLQADPQGNCRCVSLNIPTGVPQKCTTISL